MQMLNRFVGGRQAVGHIDLLDTISYFEVPEKDAKKVMLQLTGIRFKGRQVRCNDSDNKSPIKKKAYPDFTEEGWAMRKPRKKKK
jgi:ATP-dependent RNA helicase DeaD